VSAVLGASLRRALTLPRIGLPPSTLLVGIVALAYALPGLFGHDPWKPEDAIGIGIVHQMLEPGQWLLPHLAGELFTEDGPFHFWVAAVFAKLFGALFGMDDAARLASGAMVIAMLFLLRDAGRELYGKAQADGAMLVLIGCLGLMVHSHEVLGELGMLAGQALAWYAIALAPRKPHKAGAALGLGLAIAFLSKGFIALAAPALAAVAIFFIAEPWRTRRYALTLGEAFITFAAPVAIWGGSLYMRSPEQAATWVAAQAAVIGLPSGGEVLYDLKVLSWAAWPAWPIGIWFLWDRRRALAESGLVLPALASLLSLIAVLLTKETREVHSLALLPPLALLAGGGVERLRRGAVRALEWFGAITFTLCGALIWLGWFAMMTGTPARIARNFAKLEPGHVPAFEWLPFVIALLLSMAWLWVVLRSDRSPYRGVLYWACGAALIWGLAMTLLLSWVDYGKSYAPVAGSMSSALNKAVPGGARCIESRGLGQSQRAALDYHAGIVTLRAERHGDTRCPVLLVQARPGDNDRGLAPAWKRVWEGNRPRDKERYRLYVRNR
jgi:4-amino-4-deoxy-L-arabinose transferase-like glycosyltransferase